MHAHAHRHTQSRSASNSLCLFKENVSLYHINIIAEHGFMDLVNVPSAAARGPSQGLPDIFVNL